MLLVVSEAALTLPEESDGDGFVARFSSDHRMPIIVLQVIGIATAGLLAGYAARLWRIDASVGLAGVITAVLACTPGLATIALALAADTGAPAAADTWNHRLPRADDHGRSCQSWRCSRRASSRCAIRCTGTLPIT